MHDDIHIQTDAGLRMRILCLDFDGVVHSYTSPWVNAWTIPDPPVPGAIDYIHWALNRGWDVHIHSSRSRYWRGRRAMREYVKGHAGSLWYPAPGYRGLEDVVFNKHKPPASVSIDDRGYRFEGTWPDLSLLRQLKPWNK